MSKPDIIANTTLAGIAVDPRTLERVIPESRRPDGSYVLLPAVPVLRKEIKIRPGFTPQEDVQRFRSARQTQTDSNKLPKGHIPGWVPSSSSATTQAKTAGGMSKSAKKNAKRKEKRKEKTTEKIKDSWEEDDEDEEAPDVVADEKKTPLTPVASIKESTAGGKTTDDTEVLTEKLGKLDVR